MNKRLLILTLAFLLTPLAGWSDVILSLNGPATPVFVGSTFWVDVNVDVTALDDLYAYQFDLTFQDSLLNALQAEDGPFLPAADLIGSILYDLSVPGSIQ
jgi:hypothetical protein